jgi:hypothetical protein
MREQAMEAAMAKLIVRDRTLCIRAIFWFPDVPCLPLCLIRESIPCP